jgi:uncharacterized protein
MKKSLLLLLMFVAAVAVSHGQPTPNPFPKTIAVSGSAEMEIVPDEIYVNIHLMEYQKKGESKKDLEVIKTQFLESCKAAGIADSMISIVAMSGTNDYFWYRRRHRNVDLFTGITYQIKFRTSVQMDNLVERLDDEATRAFLIVGATHSKMTEYRRQLKIQAVKAAKEKGIYLTEAVGEKLGAAITITEPEENQLANTRSSNGITGEFSNDNYKMKDNDGGKAIEVSFRKIKLRYEVGVTFALQ